MSPDGSHIALQLELRRENKMIHAYLSSAGGGEWRVLIGAMSVVLAERHPARLDAFRELMQGCVEDIVAEICAEPVFWVQSGPLSRSKH